MLVIGLTGGIGSGKSLVCELFKRLGVPIIDADVIAKSLTQPDMPAFQQICAHFGDHVLSQKTLDRQKLRKIIFRDAQERAWLEGLLHPMITAEMQRQLSLIHAPYCLLAIPLLLEVAPYTFIDRILVIDSHDETRIARVMQRDQISREAVCAMMATQVTQAERLQRADDILENNGDIVQLEKKVKVLHEQYMALS